MTDVLSPTPEGIERSAELLRAGEVVAFPTDTVYGVGVAGARSDRLEALFALKHRPPEKQIPILVAGLGQVIEAGWRADDRAHRLTERFWPGALTLVLGDGNGATQAFRAPDHPVALALIRLARSWQPPPTARTSPIRSGPTRSSSPSPLSRTIWRRWSTAARCPVAWRPPCWTCP
jgi:L-threonylcarbamoyladenylate synthase